jgi:hypothetical protein
VKRSITIIGSALCLAFGVVGASAQIMVPSQQHEALDVEIHSLRDEVTLYMGDPQELLRMRYRPDDIEPRIHYASQEHAVLRILDSYLFQEIPDLSTMPEEQQKKYLPDSQTWEIRISPAGPTKFALRCENGKGTFDFTDFQVQDVHIQGEESRFDVEFVRPNSITLESFRAHASRGSFEFRDLLNARAKDVVLFTPGSTCRVEIKGKPFDGETNLLFQGPPSRMELVVSRKIGLRVKGPAKTLERFKAKHMVQNGDEWVSQNYESSRCRVQLTFAEEFPNFELAWD